ncbi:hypothetical protein ACN47E_001820 [Coniothyrium glycines]
MTLERNAQRSRNTLASGILSQVDTLIGVTSPQPCPAGVFFVAYAQVCWQLRTCMYVLSTTQSIRRRPNRMAMEACFVHLNANRETIGASTSLTTGPLDNPPAPFHTYSSAHTKLAQRHPFAAPNESLLHSRAD